MCGLQIFGDHPTAGKRGLEQQREGAGERLNLRTKKGNLSE
jgi:hypothetical protein